MDAVAVVARLMVAFLFLTSGAQKLGSFNLRDGGPTMDIMAPKMDAFVNQIEHVFHQQLYVPRAMYTYALGAAIGLELGGAVLFTMGSKLGAAMLATFLAAITPIMHDFWNQEPGSEARVAEMIQASKNLALFGALLVILTTPSRARVRL